MGMIGRWCARGGCFVCLGGALILTGYGCDDDGDSGTGGTTSTSGTGGAVGGMGGTGGSTGESVTFVVLSPDENWPPGEPVEGATVAFDAPDGTRVEAESGADGKVTFDGIDWSLGTATATVHLDGYGMGSFVNIDEAALAASNHVDDAVVLGLGRLMVEEPETAQVTGTFTGLQDPNNSLTVMVVGVEDGGSIWQGTGNGTFVLTVPKGKPFFIQGVESSATTTLASGQGFDWPIHQVAQQSHDAIDSNVTGVVLDFGANAMTTHTASATYTLPTRPDSPVRSAFPYTYICASNSWYCYGYPTHVDVSTDGSQFEVDYLWVEPSWAEGVVTLCGVLEPNSDQLQSWVFVDGYPEGGELATLLDVPKLTSPPSATAPHGLHAPIVWELFDTDVPFTNLVMHRNDGTDPWYVVSGPNTTSITIPAPPTTVDAADLLGSSWIPAEMLLGTPDWDTYRWTRGARTELLLQP